MVGMEHWSKTSSLEPLPVGRHKKRVVDIGRPHTKLPEAVKVQPLVRPLPVVPRKPFGEETNRASDRGRGEMTKMRVESADYKFGGKMIRDGGAFGGERNRASDRGRGEMTEMRVESADYKLGGKMITVRDRGAFGEERNRASYGGRWEMTKMRVESGDYKFRGKMITARDGGAFGGERNRAIDRDRGEMTKISAESAADYKFGGKMITVRDGGPNVENRKGKRPLNEEPERKGSFSKAMIIHESHANKEEKRIIPSNHNPLRSLISVQGTPEDERRIARIKVKEMLSLYRAYCDSLLEKSKNKKGFMRVDLIAGGMVKDDYKIVHTQDAILGAVPGIEIGDHFNYRMELHISGLHRPLQCGIDTMDIGGRRIAVSIVDSGKYHNYMSNQDTLVYCGTGCSTEDQKMKMENQAMINSIRERNPVRVVRGSKKLKSLTFFYDGLYNVVDVWEDVTAGGNVMKFKLVRVSGQTSLLPPRKRILGQWRRDDRYTKSLFN